MMTLRGLYFDQAEEGKWTVGDWELAHWLVWEGWIRARVVRDRQRRRGEEDTRKERRNDDAA